jgi:hypothetical protein
MRCQSPAVLSRPPEESQSVIHAGKALEPPRGDSWLIDLLDDPGREVPKCATEQTELEMRRIEVNVVNAVRVEEPARPCVVGHRPQVVLSWSEPRPVPIESGDNATAVIEQHVGSVQVVMAEDVGHRGRPSSGQHFFEPIEPRGKFLRAVDNPRVREPRAQVNEWLVGRRIRTERNAVGSQIVDSSQQMSDLDAVTVGGVPAQNVWENGVRTTVLGSRDVGPQRSRYRKPGVGQSDRYFEVDGVIVIAPDLDEPTFVDDPTLTLEAHRPRHERVALQFEVATKFASRWSAWRAHSEGRRY